MAAGTRDGRTDGTSRERRITLGVYEAIEGECHSVHSRWTINTGICKKMASFRKIIFRERYNSLNTAGSNGETMGSDFLEEG